MQKSFQKTLYLLGGRIARNIYFWIILFLLKQSDIDDQFAYSNAFYYGMMVLLMLLLAFYTYFNSFVLVKYLLDRKRRVLYFICSIIFAYSFTFFYVFVLKFLPTCFPGLDASEVSMITNHVSPDISFSAIADDTQSFFSILVVWNFIFTLLWYANESIAKMKQMQETINKHLETELLFLKNQLNPHFLFNTLNNLYALTLKKSDDAPEAILKLSAILRYILYESNAPLISFEKEKEVMQAYIDIEMLRLPETDKLSFSMMGDGSRSIPPLLWLPVLENVFKHGANQITDDLFIDYRFSLQGNTLTIYSKNSTKTNTQKSDATGGIGLTNLRKRLEMLYPGMYSINSTLENNYFIMQVQITLS